MYRLLYIKQYFVQMANEVNIIFWFRPSFTTCFDLLNHHQVLKNSTMEKKKTPEKNNQILRILYKMEIVNRVSAFQIYQNFSDVIAEKLN